MPQFIVLAVYRGEVNGKATVSRDFQGILVRARNWRHAVTKVSQIKVHKYKNLKGEWVRWPLVNIMCCGNIDKGTDLEEVTGFIAGKSELFGKSSLKTPGVNVLLKASRKMPMLTKR